MLWYNCEMWKYRQTPNFDTVSVPSLGFIIHGTLGSYEGAVEWLCTPPNKRNPVSYSSAHFVIAKSGAVTQLADIRTRTWHAGTVNKPDQYASEVLPKSFGVYKNPNDSFIGIELEWFEGDRITPEQYKSLIDVIKFCGIQNPVLLTHSQVTSFKADFGEYSKEIIETLKTKLSNPDKETIKQQNFK